jgi:hypothetical protein
MRALLLLIASCCLVGPAFAQSRPLQAGPAAFSNLFLIESGETRVSLFHTIKVQKGDWIALYLNCSPANYGYLCVGGASYSFNGDPWTEFPLRMYRYTDTSDVTHQGIGVVAPETGKMALGAAPGFAGDDYKWTLMGIRP